MNKLRSVLSTVVLTAIIAAFVYEPVSIAVFRLTEPNFGYPIRSNSGKMIIRNDSHGDGDFGAKRHNGRFHSGIDIEAPVGTPVYAAKSGLAFCGNVPTGYGKYVMIYHPDSYQSFYGHLSGFCITTVKKVRKGDMIGFVGKTGNAANKNIAAHLHFEIRKDGVPQDPRGLMKQERVIR